MSNPSIQAVLSRITNEQCYFITDQDLKDLRALVPNPAFPVLVRCGTGRFVCSLNVLEFKMKAVADKDDYVRDVSIPSPIPPEWQRLIELSK